MFHQAKFVLPALFAVSLIGCASTPKISTEQDSRWLGEYDNCGKISEFYLGLAPQPKGRYSGQLTMLSGGNSGTKYEVGLNADGSTLTLSGNCQNAGCNKISGLKYPFNTSIEEIKDTSHFTSEPIENCKNFKINPYNDFDGFHKNRAKAHRSPYFGTESPYRCKKAGAWIARELPKETLKLELNLKSLKHLRKALLSPSFEKLFGKSFTSLYEQEKKDLYYSLLANCAEHKDFGSNVFYNDLFRSVFLQEYGRYSRNAILGKDKYSIARQQERKRLLIEKNKEFKEMGLAPGISNKANFFFRKENTDYYIYPGFRSISIYAVHEIKDEDKILKLEAKNEELFKKPKEGGVTLYSKGHPHLEDTSTLNEAIDSPMLYSYLQNTIAPEIKEHLSKNNILFRQKFYSDPAKLYIKHYVKNHVFPDSPFSPRKSSPLMYEVYEYEPIDRVYDWDKPLHYSISSLFTGNTLAEKKVKLNEHIEYKEKIRQKIGKISRERQRADQKRIEALRTSVVLDEKAWRETAINNGHVYKNLSYWKQFYSSQRWTFSRVFDGRFDELGEKQSFNYSSSYVYFINMYSEYCRKYLPAKTIKYKLTETTTKRSRYGQTDKSTSTLRNVEIDPRAYDAYNKYDSQNGDYITADALSMFRKGIVKSLPEYRSSMSKFFQVTPCDSMSMRQMNENFIASANNKPSIQQRKINLGKTEKESSEVEVELIQKNPSNYQYHRE